MTTVYFSPIGNSQFEDANGVPYNAGLLYTYTAGSDTPKNTYTTSAGNVAQANPIVLNSRGIPANPVWLLTGAYKFILKTSAGVTVQTWDDVSGINDIALSQSEWVASGLTPTYISATQFSLVGDQTAAFQVGRRIRTTNTAGTVYGVITASAFAAVTTVTVLNDSGALDSGLSAVSYGLLTAINSSLPYDGSKFTNSLSGDVDLNNTGQYFTGPTVAQGTAGVWFASGKVTVIRAGGVDTFNAKLWDGTTVIDSAQIALGDGVPGIIALSGYISAPAGNIRISVNDQGSTSGKIKFNSSGNSKDSTLSVFRIGQ